MKDLDYLDHLARDSERFADVLAAADLIRPVPTCPDWNASDLFWHLTEVQWFWGTIVRERLDSPEGTEGRQPVRPSDLDALVHLYATVSDGLHQTLTDTPGDTPVWTWADDQTAGFVLRRQTHEALIHRVDAELTVGDLTDMDPALSSDGVDEALRIMHGGLPGWGRFDREGTARVETTDTGDAWTVGVGRFTGTDPDSGKEYDQLVLDVVDGVDDTGDGPDAVARGTAADLDLWLWGRPTGHRLERTGDEDVLSRLQAVIDQGVD